MKHHPHDQFELHIEIDSHGHALLTIRTESFQQLRAAILALAEFLKDQEQTPATKLNLAAGAIEGR